MHDPGLMVKMLCSQMRERIDHAREHLGQMEADLTTLGAGAWGKRLNALRATVQHCESVIGDMVMVLNTLKS